MKTTPDKAYVYQPMPPQEDGRFYGVGGLELFGIEFDDAVLTGITKSDAEEVVRIVNANPDFAASFICQIKSFFGDRNRISSCGCRFENSYSSSVLLCERCSNLPCHTNNHDNEGVTQ